MSCALRALGITTKTIPVIAYVDHKSVIEAVYSTKIVDDKRLRVDIAAISESLATPYATSFRRRFLAYHHAMTYPHSNIILSLFSIPLVLKCAAKSLEIGLQIKI